jgi:hypothetical protein
MMMMAMSSYLKPKRYKLSCTGPFPSSDASTLPGELHSNSRKGV